VKKARSVNISRNGIQQIHLCDLHADDGQDVGERITSCAGFVFFFKKRFSKRCCKMHISHTYHFYVQRVAVIPESVALEESFRDHNVHEAAGLTYLSVNHRRGHCLRSFLKKSSRNTRVRAHDGINVEIIFKDNGNVSFVLPYS